MAVSTSKTYRNQALYSVFVRNYSEEGTFEGVRWDLQRIKDLGVDILWLLPIHPIGEKARKGMLRSPYAIHPGLPGGKPGIRHAGGFETLGGRGPWVGDALHYRRGL